MMSFSAV